MNNRLEILQAIRNNKPSAAPLPEADMNAMTYYENALEQFIQVLALIGGEAIIADGWETVTAHLENAKQQKQVVINTIPEAGDVIKGLDTADVNYLASVELAFIRGRVAVAENGAIWLYEKDMKHRLLPFICEQLVLVIHRSAIVSNMHEAYKKIDSSAEGFGVFIAGPSKTADIEQSLVIGAHGAKALRVYIL